MSENLQSLKDIGNAIREYDERMEREQAKIVRGIWLMTIAATAVLMYGMYFS